MKTKRVEKKEQQWCPYCEDELANSQFPYCQPCKVESFICLTCGKPVPRQNKICPKCGSPMKPAAE
jgi:RNA polymerase subunit RPABC4/transcription elongation factor Spt4